MDDGPDSPSNASMRHSTPNTSIKCIKPRDNTANHSENAIENLESCSYAESSEADALSLPAGTSPGHSLNNSLAAISALSSPNLDQSDSAGHMTADSALDEQIGASLETIDAIKRHQRKKSKKPSIWLGLKNALISKSPKSTASSNSLGSSSGSETKSMTLKKIKKDGTDKSDEKFNSSHSETKSEKSSNKNITYTRSKTERSYDLPEYASMKSARRFSSNPDFTLNKLRNSFGDDVTSNLRIQNKSTTHLSANGAINSSFDTDSVGHDANSDNDSNSQKISTSFDTSNASSVLKSEYPQVAWRLKKYLMRFIKEQTMHYHSNPHLSLWASQLTEISQSCIDSLDKNTLNLEFLFDLMDRIDKLIQNIKETDLALMQAILPAIRKLSIIISKPCRIMEIIERSPNYLQDQVDYVLEHNPNQTGDLIKYLTNSLTTPIDFIDATTLDKINSSINQRTSFLEYQEKIKVEDFRHIKNIGKGKYGVTTLVTFKDTGLVFCLKTVPKSSYTKKSQVDKLFRERDIHFYLKNIFIVNLYCTFSTDESMCFLMEYIEAGDIAKYLDMGLAFTHVKIREIIAQLTLALEFLHSKEIVHRDLKPSNILLTKNFSIKLADFGLSEFALKYELHDFTTNPEDGNHFAGTTFYIAPEVILNQASGKSFDWWAIGIIAFEMLVGEPPFTGSTVDEIFDCIVTEDLSWPEEFKIEPEYREFVTQLLVKDQHARLGADSSDSVKNHAYFRDLNWDEFFDALTEYDKAQGRKSLQNIMPVCSETDVCQNAQEAKDKVNADLVPELDQFTFVSKDIVELIKKTGDSISK